MVPVLTYGKLAIVLLVLGASCDFLSNPKEIQNILFLQVHTIF